MVNVLILNLIEASGWMSANLRSTLKDVQTQAGEFALLIGRIRVAWGAHARPTAGLLNDRRGGCGRELLATCRPWRETLMRGELHRKSIVEQAFRAACFTKQGPMRALDFAQSTCVSLSSLDSPKAERACLEACLLISSPSLLNRELPLERKFLHKDWLEGRLPVGPHSSIREIHAYDQNGDLPDKSTLRLLLSEAVLQMQTEEPRPTDLFVCAREGEAKRLYQALGFEPLCRFLKSENADGEVLMHIGWDKLRAGVPMRVAWVDESWMPDLLAYRLHKKTPASASVLTLS